MSNWDSGGWDNDNFLDSLGRGNTVNDEDVSDGNRNDAIDRANDEYYEQSRYGRPAVVDMDTVGASGPADVNSYSTTTSSSRLSYADSLQQQRQQNLQQQQQHQSHQQQPSPTTTSRLSYANSLQQHQQQPQQQQQPPPNSNISDNMAAMSDAAAEVYAYSYNKNVDAPSAGSSSISASPPVDPNATTEQQAPTGEPSLSPDLVNKAKASHDDEKEEAAQGGSRFRDLMERAKEKQPEEAQLLEVQRQEQQQLAQQRLQNPLLAATTATPPVVDNSIVPPSSIMTPEELMNLSIEEQARLYREFFYVQQQKQKSMQEQLQPHQQAKSIGSTPDNYLQADIGFDGRKIGRNRDADAISNASDVYFARLKRDSTTRNIARYSGDHAKANDVFHDPTIQDIKAPVNPYLEDQQKRMRDVIETVPEEMLVFQDYEDPETTLSKDEMQSYSGISYKEKMEQKKRERDEKRKRNQQ